MPADRPAAPSSTPRTSVAISFGSPAGESGVTRLDLNDILIRHPQAAFLMRIAGSSMRETLRSSTGPWMRSTATS